MMHCTVSLLLAMAFLVFDGSAQFKEALDRNAALLVQLGGYGEGYTETVAGETMQYPRMSQTNAIALLTRAGSGTMAIEWKTALPGISPGAKEASFVVRAGMYGQEEVGRKFQMFVNGVPRFIFSTTGTESWAVSGEGGGALMYDAVMRDQYGDLFGYLRMRLPAEWIVAGEPVRLKVVGERAGSAAWFMVYQDPAVLPSLREKIASDAYCDLSVETRGSRNEATVSASANWIGRKLKCAPGGREGVVVPLLERNGRAFATFSFEGLRSEPLKLFIDAEPIADLPAMSAGGQESRIFPRKIVSVKTRITPTGAWMLEYQSSHAPEFGTSLVDLSESYKGEGDLRLMISSHQDIGWMDTPDQCVKDRDEKVITPALRLLREDPAYRFDLEDVLELREYLGRHPGSKAEIQQYVREGRMGIGASFTMPYEDLCSGEMLVRQFYAGRRWFIKNFPGCDTRTAWNPDVPGRSAQSLQIMQKAGVRNLVISRHERGLYDWRSPDGSGVLVFSPHHYGLLSERTTDKPFSAAAASVASFAREWRSGISNGGSTVPLLLMSDMSTPVTQDDFMNTWNGLKSISRDDGSMQSLALPPIRYSTAEEYFAVARDREKVLPVVEGERPNIWLYIHGPTHHWAISAKREADVFLTSAEIFSTIDALLGGSFSRYPQAELTDAWESQVYPDHGWGGKNGQITDSVFLRKYEHARDISKDLHARATASIAARIRGKSGKGIPLVVFNSLSWKRTGPVEVNMTFAQGRVAGGFTLRSGAGAPVPVQVNSAERYADGSLKSAEFVFVAANVPSIGYATYYVVPSPGAFVLARTDGIAPRVLESSPYRVTLGEGGVQQITDREFGGDLLSTKKFLGGELFTMQSVGEDAGEWAEPQMPTMEGFDRLSSHKPAWRLVESGPVRQVVEVRQPTDHTTVVQRLVVYRHLKRIDFETSLLKWDGTRYREFRLAFPFNMSEGQVTYEVPFAALEVGKDEMKGAAGERYTQIVSSVRPRALQNWISVSDARVGVTISSSVAVWDYQDPTAQPVAGPLLQPVLLASRRSCHGEGNWYLQEGDHHYRFSLTSHRPGWTNGRKFGIEANTPFTVVADPAGAGKGELPQEMSFCSLDADNIALSTLKKAEEGDGVVARFVELDGRPATASLRFFRPILGAEATDIIEEGGTPVPVQNDRVAITLGHHAIGTMKILPAPAGSPR